MSVIGIDFGNQSCYIAVARAGGIETIANDYSLRATPSCVAFTNRNRIMGVAAANQRITNVKNTIVGFKRLLGRRHNVALLDEELSYLPIKTLTTMNGSVGIRVDYLNKEHVFIPEQITAMLFTKLKDIAENALKAKVNDCVISVPSFFTQVQRKALLDAAQVAGLNVLRLFNDTTSTALAYGIYREDLPNADEKPRTVVFVDCGHSSLQVCAAAFNKGKLKMLASASDPQTGGRNFDSILTAYFSKEFYKKYRIDPKKSVRACLRLQAEVEKLKKQMSANSTKLPLNIECFMEDRDLHSEMQRSDMEKLCSSVFRRIEETLTDFLENSKLSLDDIYAVEIVGGSTRIPAIKKIIKKVFRKDPSTTLNQDEAIARGCALQCAALSPAIRVREFSVKDIQTYPIKLKWDALMEDEGEMNLCSAGDPFPFSKILTLRRVQPFTVEANYILQGEEWKNRDPFIGKYLVKDVRLTSDNEVPKVKVRVQVNLHGILSVDGASFTEKLTPAEMESEVKELTDGAQTHDGSQANVPMENGGDDVKRSEEEAEQQQQQQQQSEQSGEQQQQSEQSGDKQQSEQNNEQQQQQQSEQNNEQQQQQQQSEQNNEQQQDKDKKKKVPLKKIELNVEVLKTYGLTQAEVDGFCELEGKMIANDRQEEERVDAKNALEEYVYDLRGKLMDDAQLLPFVKESDRTTLSEELNDVVSWLYEEGEDCNRQIYVNKLDHLRKMGEPIKNRKIEADIRPTVFEDLARSVQRSYKIIEQHRNNDERYNHIPESDIQRATQETQKTEKWLEEKRIKVQSTPKYENPPVTVAQIRQEKQNFENIVGPIFDKPKPKPPKVETPPPNPSEEKATGDNAREGGGGGGAYEEKMDVD